MSYLTEAERYKIETLLQEGHTRKYIAEKLGRHYNTICNEVKRGTITKLDTHLRTYEAYDAFRAHSLRVEYSHNKGRGLNIGNNIKLADYLENKILKENYSPYAAMVAARKACYNVNFCLTTLYSYIHKRVFCRLDGKAIKGRKGRRDVPERRRALNNKKGRSIEERPRDVSRRESFGHWEMDTVVSGIGDRVCLLVLTERMTRFEIVRRLDSKSQSCLVSALDELERSCGGSFSRIFRTITADNGVENLDQTGVERSCLGGGFRTIMYYCHPYCSSERATNENQNRLIRRFVPKGAHISDYGPEEIQAIEDWMNDYPRRIFDGRSARQMFYECYQI